MINEILSGTIDNLAIHGHVQHAARGADGEMCLASAFTHACTDLSATREQKWEACLALYGAIKNRIGVQVALSDYNDKIAEGYEDVVLLCKEAMV